jgi:DNA-binding IclR family transcriptional regulator
VEKTLIKGLKVLEAVARKTEPCGVSELAKELAITKSNVYRLLQTLRAADYVRHDPETGLYSASLRLFEMGMLIGSHIDVREVSRPILVAVVERTMENTSIGILEGTDVLYVDRVDSPQRVRAVVRNGERLPAHTSSAGKLLLAHADDETVERMRGTLDPFTEHTIVDFESLRSQLRQIRAQGYCVTRAEWHVEISSVAVPIFDRDGDVSSALMVSGPTTRFTDDKLPGFLDALRWGADEIAKRLP